MLPVAAVAAMPPPSPPPPSPSPPPAPNRGRTGAVAAAAAAAAAAAVVAAAAAVVAAAAVLNVEWTAVNAGASSSRNRFGVQHLRRRRLQPRHRPHMHIIEWFGGVLGINTGGKVCRRHQ